MNTITSNALFHIVLRTNEALELVLTYIVDFGSITFSQTSKKSQKKGTCLAFEVNIGHESPFSEMLLQVLNCVDSMDYTQCSHSTHNRVVAEIMIGCIYVTLCRSQDLTQYASESIVKRYILALLTALRDSLDSTDARSVNIINIYPKSAKLKTQDGKDYGETVQSEALFKEYYDVVFGPTKQTNVDISKRYKFVQGLVMILYAMKSDYEMELSHRCLSMIYDVNLNNMYYNDVLTKHFTTREERRVLQRLNPEDLRNSLAQKLPDAWKDEAIVNQIYLCNFIDFIRIKELIFDAVCPVIRRYVFLIEHIAMTMLQFENVPSVFKKNDSALKTVTDHEPNSLDNQIIEKHKLKEQQN